MPPTSQRLHQTHPCVASESARLPVVSHVFVFDAAAYPGPLRITDAATNIQATLDEEVDIVRNAIELARAIAIDLPHVALCQRAACETVHSNRA